MKVDTIEIWNKVAIVANITNLIVPYFLLSIKYVKAGKIDYRLDKSNIIHCIIGKASFGAQKLQENFEALMDAIIKSRPEAAKGQYIKSCTVVSTMGPGIKISVGRYC